MDTLSPAERSVRMSLIHSKDSKFERRMRSAIHRLGYRFRKHVSTMPGKPDLVFVSRRKVIFLNGCFWHGHHCRLSRLPKTHVDYWLKKLNSNKARDARNRSHLRKAGWKVLTLWECQLSNFDSLLRRVERFLESS
jgi:DNA mismatch endonuclease (patch repair protein)